MRPGMLHVLQGHSLMGGVRQLDIGSHKVVQSMDSSYLCLFLLALVFLIRIYFLIGFLLALVPVLVFILVHVLDLARILVLVIVHVLALVLILIIAHVFFPCTCSRNYYVLARTLIIMIFT